MNFKKSLRIDLIMSQMASRPSGFFAIRNLFSMMEKAVQYRRVNTHAAARTKAPITVVCEKRRVE